MQATLDDLGAPLADVTFVVVDLETTGGAPTTDRITEIGAVRLRGGECLGTFQTLVNPGLSIPPAITVLTGITDAMVLPAPPIEAVLPSLLEFCGDAVFVGHNVGFDAGFVRQACLACGYPPPTWTRVDTAALARRLLVDEVPNHRLGTLADRLRLDHKPSHRALDDALATGDLLHVLLERAARLGVLGLDDLLALPTIAGHPQAAKLKLTNGLPRAPGVYVFRDRSGRPLYVGKATNLRARVRSYFSSERRRKVAQLLRETVTIDHTVCSSLLEAEVLEVRRIADWAPRFNRHGTRAASYTYLKLTCGEAFPRLSVVRAPKDDGGYYLGPLPSTKFAKRVAEAIESSVPLRRCTARPTGTRDSPCAAAQLGVATCPCAGAISPADYARLVERTLRGLRDDPELLLVPLQERMAALAREQRFEEAADVRDRAAALSSALERQRRLDRLRRAGRLRLEWDGGGAEILGGRLVRAWAGAQEPLALDEPEAVTCTSVVARDEVDELLCIARWLEDPAADVRIAHCDGGLASPRRASRPSRPARGDGWRYRDGRMDVLAGLIIFFGVTAACVGFTRWRLHRHNRVHATVPSQAPLRWIVSPAPAARLHRRLQTTVRVAEARGGARSPVVADVGAHAVDLDHRLVLASRHPWTDRWSTLRGLSAECDELERLALAVDPARIETTGVGPPHERLTALAEARDEVEEISRRFAPTPPAGG